MGWFGSRAPGGQRSGQRNRDALYERGYAFIEPGGLVVAYTDGITEAFNRKGEAFGTERLRRLVRRQVWTSSRELVEAIFETVRKFSGLEQPDDDQTVVALLRRS